jgi:type VI secretion system secreted protein VgrG
MRRTILSVSLVAIVVLIWPATASANFIPPLGTAGNYAVIAGSTITNTGPSWITGKMALSPGTSVTGFPPGTSGAKDIGPSSGPANGAKAALTNAYGIAAGETPFITLPTELGGRTLKRGTYRQGASGLTGTLTLDGGGTTSGVWIFQIASTLITGAATGARVRLINGAQPCDVFWQVASSATIGVSTVFVGNIMALDSITMNTGATLNGRAMAQTAAVNLHTNRIIQPTGCGFAAPAFVAPPAGNIFGAGNLGVPSELLGSFPWLLIVGIGAGVGATALGVSARRRRRIA